jgi:hypothetical protein
MVDMSFDTITTKPNKNWWVLLGIAIFSTTTHLIPFLIYGANPLGYDTGFYRRYLIQPFISFPNTGVPGLGSDAMVPRCIFDFLRLLHIPTDIILYGSYIFFFVTLSILFFKLLEHFTSRHTAIIGAVLLILSPVAYNAYWFMLWKNIFALNLLVLALLFFEKKRLWPLIVLDIAIAFSNKTTALIYMMALALFCITAISRKKEAGLHFLITGVLLVSTQIGSYTFVEGIPTAIFMSWSDYLHLSVASILGSVSTLYLYIRNFFIKKINQIGWTTWFTSIRSKISLFVCFCVVSIAFPILHLPFYERIFVFSDIALCAMAAYGIMNVIISARKTENKTAQYVYVLFLFIITGFAFGNLWKEIKQLTPLVSSNDITVIENIDRIVPPSATILTTSDDAPWFEGWTHAHIAAPGMLNDRHNLDAWTAFWYSTSTNDRIAFLNTFKKPLYVATLGDISDLIGTPPDCIASSSPHLFIDNCK